MNINIDWMIKVFEDRQIRIVGWMGNSISGEQLESILNDARSKESGFVDSNGKPLFADLVERYRT